MQATNFFVRNPIEISLNISRFLFQKDLCNWGLCSKPTLAKLDAIWKAIFERDNNGYSPNQVASWRLLVFSQRIQVRNLTRFESTVMTVTVNENSFPIIIDREIYTLAHGRLLPARSGSEKLAEIPTPQNQTASLCRLSRGYFVTRDNDSLTVWKRQSPILTLGGPHYFQDGHYHLHYDFLLCELTKQDGTKEWTVWNLVGDIRKTVIPTPSDSVYMGFHEDKICWYQKNLGLAFYSLKDASLCETRSLPDHFNVKNMVVSNNNVFYDDPSGEIHCYDLPTNEVTKRYPFAKVQHSLCYIVNGNRVCIYNDGILKIFDRDTQEVLLSREGRTRGTPVSIRIHSGILHVKTTEDLQLYNMQNFEFLKSFCNPHVESGDGWVFKKEVRDFVNLLAKPARNPRGEQAPPILAAVGQNVYCFFKGLGKCIESINNLHLASEVARGHSSSFSNAAFLLDSNNHNVDDSGDDSD